MRNKILEITSEISIPLGEILIQYIRSSGPGGQNVNKLATAAQLRFNVLTSNHLPGLVRQRLLTIASGRISTDGFLIIDGRRYRTQERNRRDVLDRFVALIRRAAEQPKQRRKTNPPAAADLRRLEKKKNRSIIKIRRRPVEPEE
ncbi:MAG: alternative ribosome rescue aminoacyl-tRNA hydrolase ArfB [Candidatus Neomarinimicrobiota bacterium]